MPQKLLAAITILLTLCACEKVDLTPYLDPDTADGYEVTLRVDSYSVVSFDGASDAQNTRAVTATAADMGSVVNIAVFSDGEKVKTVNQKISDPDFGTVTLKLAAGTYTIVALVHGRSGNATISSAEKVTFPNNKVTDTFALATDITVDGSKTVDMRLRRVVAMFRLTVEDAIPDDVERMQLYYTGGSSTLNAVTGFGCVNSRQTELRDVADRTPGQVFEVYTFPHDQTGTLKMTLSALDAAGEAHTVKSLDDVPVEQQKITTHTMQFFAEEADARENCLHLTGDNEWRGTIAY